jgi:hypothetical protein
MNSTARAWLMAVLGAGPLGTARAALALGTRSLGAMTDTPRRC